MLRRRRQGDQSADAQFSGFFNQPLESIALWDGCGQSQVLRWWSVSSHLQDFEFDIAFANDGDAARGDTTFAVEQFHIIAYLMT